MRSRPTTMGTSITPPNMARVDDLIKVKLVTEPKVQDPAATVKRWFGILCLCLVVVLLAGFSALYLSPTVSAVLYPPDQANVWFALTQPKYLAIGDEGTIEVATTSIAQQPISVTSSIAFTPYEVTPGSLVIPVNVSSGSSNVFTLDNLAPYERRINYVKFQVGVAPQVLVATSNFTPSLQMGISTGPYMFYDLRPIELWPLPYSRLIVTVALTGVVGFAIGLAKDEFKKWITGSGTST
jgi:hypothetical protein